MLWTASKIKGYAISASDGKIGTVSDILFDDTNWLVRWLTVDTGTWLSGRTVLVPSAALAHLDAHKEQCAVKLTMQQIKDSPDVDTERSVTRQMESTSYSHYGYLPYWNSGFGYIGGLGAMGSYGYMGGMGGARLATSRSREEDAFLDAERDHDDVHLRSAAAVTGYHIHASDGQIGHVAGFILEDTDWTIRYLIVDTQNWWPGKKVLISPRSVTDIDWNDGQVRVGVDRQKIKDAPAYDASLTIDPAYEQRFQTYYHIDMADA
ncbi:MAG: PRC-barrel domain-containing protein [bacterium]